MSAINKTGGFKMINKNRTYHQIRKLLGLLVLTLFFASNSLFSQTESEQLVELSDISKANILNGIQSENYGLKMSSIFLAGKYKISDVGKELVKEIIVSDNEEVCQMLVWSLYQIGDESCCKEMRKIIENHPSEKIKSFCESIQKIKQYDPTNEKSKEKNS